MSSFNRRIFLRGTLLGSLVVGSMTLAGCGFSPAYGPNGAANHLLGGIQMDDPTDRDSYLLVQHLETRFGRSQAPRFGLSTSLKIDEEKMAISANNITNRFNVVGRVTFALRDLDGGEVISSGTLNSFTGYSATGTTAATQAAQRDARKRLMIILADQIVTRLIATAPSSAQ